MNRHFRRVLYGCIAIALLASCRGAQPIGAADVIPQSPVTTHPAQPKYRSKSFLYAGSLWPLLSKYALDSSKPLRSIKTREGPVAIALDSIGNLIAETGDISHGFIAVYDAASLKRLRAIDGIWAVSLAVDRDGYVYAADCGDGIVVLSPGGTKVSHVIYQRVRGACTLAFSRSGDLYVANEDSISVYAATKKPGHTRFLRRITDGIKFPSALAFDPAGNLFVANCVTCVFSKPGRRRDSVSVYSPDGSTPIRHLTTGIRAPDKLEVDSTGRLYVANSPFTVKGYQPGWITVYAPGGTLPINKITDGIDVPKALAIDRSDRLYVANEYKNSVTVYGPGGTKLLRTITDGVRGPTSLSIASP